MNIRNRIISLVLIFILTSFLVSINITNVYSTCINGTPTLDCGPKDNGYCDNIPGGSEGDTGGYNCAKYAACGGQNGCYHHFYVCNTPCGSGGGTEPTCEEEDECTPTCPAGTYSQNVGGSSTTESCSYKTGKVKSNGSCDIDTNNISCYSLPTTTTTNISLTSSANPYGCTLSGNWVGNTLGTRLRVVSNYKESLTSTDKMVALVSWHSPATPPSISRVYESGTIRLSANNSYGVLIRKEGTSWNKVYLPGYVSGLYSWVYAGTVGNDINIIGSGGKKMAVLKNVSVVSTSTDISLVYNIEFLTHQTGSVSGTFELVLNGLKNIYANAYTQSTFLTPTGNNIIFPITPIQTSSSYSVDLINPAVDSVNYTITGPTRIDLQWAVSDQAAGSGISRVIGDSSIQVAGSINGPIDDITSGVYNYILGSGATGSSTYSGSPHLWSVNLNNRTEVIDLKSNTGGLLRYNVIAFDRACNSISSVMTLKLGSAWMTTRGGNVFSNSGWNIEIPTLTGSGGYSADSYWGVPFPFVKSQTDMTSELISASTSSISILPLLHPDLGSTKSLNHFDANNRKNYWYNDLLNRFEKLRLAQPNNFVVVEKEGDYSVSLHSTNITGCINGKACVVKVKEDLSINGPFVCNLPTIFFVEGNIDIVPDLTSPNRKNGCIFVSKGNINILAGSYKSAGSTYPKYDIVEAFMITDNSINIPLVDTTRTIRDGLLIHGSIIGFNNPSGNAINFGRNLNLLHNQTFPAVAIFFDSRYLSLSTQLIKSELEGYRREVGFKPF